jgi:hypothetical protein
MKIRLVQHDEWDRLFVNDEWVLESHEMSAKDVLEALLVENLDITIEYDPDDPEEL